jgi:putative membrane protein
MEQCTTIKRRANQTSGLHPPCPNTKRMQTRISSAVVSTLIAFLGGLVTVVVWLVVRVFPKVRRDEQLGAPRDSAEEILRERFARGEITAEEYQRSIEILRGVTTREAPDEPRGRVEEQGER